MTSSLMWMLAYLGRTGRAQWSSALVRVIEVVRLEVDGSQEAHAVQNGQGLQDEECLSVA